MNVVTVGGSKCANASSSGSGNHLRTVLAWQE
jgi:hypothetical protein